LAAWRFSAIFQSHATLKASIAPPSTTASKAVHSRSHLKNRTSPQTAQTAMAGCEHHTSAAQLRPQKTPMPSDGRLWASLAVTSSASRAQATSNVYCFVSAA
jgi:hypothetical protein